MHPTLSTTTFTGRHEVSIESTVEAETTLLGSVVVVIRHGFSVGHLMQCQQREQYMHQNVVLINEVFQITCTMCKVHPFMCFVFQCWIWSIGWNCPLASFDVFGGHWSWVVFPSWNWTFCTPLCFCCVNPSQKQTIHKSKWQTLSLLPK